VELPAGLPAAFSERGLHFMGGIHAVEHATIGLFPLLAITDREDIGGISYTGHPQTGGPAIFIYDSFPGGAGLAEQGFTGLEQLLARTLELVDRCPCDEGCPGCIHSPKCGNGNKPLDKDAALLTLRILVGEEDLEPLAVEAAAAPAEAAASVGRRRHGIVRAGNMEPPASARRTLFFDLETQRSAEEVGGWKNIDKMGLALAVVYDPLKGAYRIYYEADVEKLLLDLVMADLVVGFNIDRFDLKVLSAYTEWDLSRIRTMDMLGEIHRRLGFRLSLAHLSEVNLGEAKAGDGLQSLAWWQEGRIDLIEQYCKKDVDLTRRIYDLGRKQKFLLYRDHSNRTVRVPVDW
jgi:DEAD/DEAH box helicase domain-containing protein